MSATLQPSTATWGGLGARKDAAGAWRIDLEDVPRWLVAIGKG